MHAISGCDNFVVIMSEINRKTPALDNLRIRQDAAAVCYERIISQSCGKLFLEVFNIRILGLSLCPTQGSSCGRERQTTETSIGVCDRSRRQTRRCNLNYFVSAGAANCVWEAFTFSMNSLRRFPPDISRTSGSNSMALIDCPWAMRTKGIFQSGSSWSGTEILTMPRKGSAFARFTGRLLHLRWGFR